MTAYWASIWSRKLRMAMRWPSVMLTVHAEGAQIYECKVNSGKLVWQFREPIAALIADGKTVGRHYAGPGHGSRKNVTLTGVRCVAEERSRHAEILGQHLVGAQ
jgi:Protein of unknown function (DUF3455)